MADVIKSIFRQREVEILYELHYYSEYYSVYFNDCNVGLSTKCNYDNVISDKVIGSYDIEIPMLEIGDEFFLHDIQEVVTIKKRMRSSDGSITYYVGDKLVETENTKKTYDECVEKITYHKCEKEKLEKLEKLEKEFEDYKKEYKYKNRFFNKKADD